VQSGNPIQWWVDAAGQLNSMLDGFRDCSSLSDLTSAHMAIPALFDFDMSLEYMLEKPITKDFVPVLGGFMLTSLLIRVWILFVFFLRFTLPVIANDNNVYYPGPTWRTSSPEAQGMDSGFLVKMMHYIQSNNLDIHSIIIIRHGYDVLEAYKEPFGKNVIHIINSSTKSITSALVGIALKEGYIQSTDQKAIDIFSNQNIEDKNGNKGMITIEHLLTMSSGIDWDEPPNNKWDNYAKSRDRTRYYLNLPMKTQPGKSFNYDSGGVNLLMAILHKTSGMKTSDFIDKLLFRPVGITNYFWAADFQGINNGAGGLALTPMEMARFGYLYLKRGKWNDKEIVPAEWVESSMSRHIDTGACPFAISSTKGYGLLWWGLPFGGFTAMGAYGQFIMVMPEKDMVTVFTSDLCDDMFVPLKIMELFINRSILTSSKIEESREKRAEMATAIREFENLDSNKDIFVAEMARKISGKRFILDPNARNLESIMLSFNGTSECVYEEDYLDKNIKIAIGLDGKYLENGFKSDSDRKQLTRGRWTSDSTFMVEYYEPWNTSSKTVLKFQFDLDKLELIDQSTNATRGKMSRSLTGKIE
jgi:CubicO group peptidase (beta-lactamase class C family)